MTRMFRIVLKDSDTMTFNYTELMSDDTEITNKTCKLQKQGRNVNICTAEATDSEELIRKTFTSYSFTYDPKLYW